MKRIAVFTLSALLISLGISALAPGFTRPAAAQTATPDGKSIFLGQKCNLCHTVSSAEIEATTKSEKMKGPDLAGLAPKLEAGLIKDYLHRKVEINGKKHGKEFTGSDDQLATLIAWLQQQEKK
jgi:mono/diheme cytochrome c family protein